MDQNLIRNFAIIAHVDHGKSTLADRLLEITGTISHDKIQEQFLDSNPISRERGITIKLAPVRMNYTLNVKKYELNLIDTPGHVDFSYEVVRTMNACEGAILLVDATKGIQAQTIANYNFAKRLNLKVIPALNKIDLPSANVEKILEDMEGLGFDSSDILRISAKTGEGVDTLLQRVIEQVPPPDGDTTALTQALIFDSVYDEHKGIVIYVRVKNGSIKKGDEITFLADNSTALVLDVGHMKPTYVSTSVLQNGEVGYVITNIKDITQAKVGDTMTIKGQHPEPLPGYKPLKPFVFLSMYPLSNADFQNFRKALHTLKLTDASLVFTPEQSSIFGPGFRCGFLGLLHAQIIIERLEREFNLDVFTAPPSIEYEVEGESVTNPKDFDISKKDIKEPYMLAEIYTPQEYLGSILELIYARRGEQQDITYYSSQVRVTFVMPLANVIYDFFDKVKSISSGYASFDYEFLEYRPSDLARVDISVNEQVIPELSFIVHKSESEFFARKIVELLAKEIPKHQFVIAVRAQIGSRVIASEKIAALSKNVTAKLYGGDVTRKNKLLDKQKEGKKKMKMIGRVSVPKEAFLSVLKV
ncbi:MAG TPA: translation elongation factor 4 [Candidatus Levybacteria bacterium]|nr:translation elongation factor 4 [Candidatus Levybacteria bacterium]